jgi:peptide/nickel transport system permease protein
MAAAGPVLSPLELTRRRRAWAGWVRLGRLERAGLAVLALTAAVAVLAPLLAPYSPTTAVHAESFAPPGTHGLLVGSDELSRDLFSRVLYGIRASWLSALAVIASGVLIGGLIGTVAGIAGGWIDTTLMRVTALFLALPAAVLAIAVIAALGPSLPHTLVAVGIVWWPGTHGSSAPRSAPKRCVRTSTPHGWPAWAGRAWRCGICYPERFRRCWSRPASMSGASS